MILCYTESYRRKSVSSNCYLVMPMLKEKLYTIRPSMRGAENNA